MNEHKKYRVNREKEKNMEAAIHIQIILQTVSG